MTTAPDETERGRVDSDYDGRIEPGATDDEADEHDDWFRDVADPDEISERDRQVAEAEQAASDAFDADDTAALQAAIARRERAFWAMPVDESSRPDAVLEAAAADHWADDDADGW